jgi:hypothetical protein
MRRRLTGGLIGVGCLALLVSYGCGSDRSSFSAAPGGEGGITGEGGEPGSTAGTAGSTSAAGAPAAGGAAGAPCSDLDNDGDGQSECEGDCDDDDRLSFLGNTEYCGDNADNNCDGVPDEVCGGLGTFVSTLTGDDANPGTMDESVQTIGQGMANAVQIQATAGGRIDVFVAEGGYLEKVTLVQGINLLGGYDCETQPCPWSRSRQDNLTEIINVDAEGVLADDTISRATRVDGFTVTGLDISVDGRTAAMTLDGGTPTITNNVIVGADVTNAAGQTVGIRILSPSNDIRGALIDSNTVLGGATAGRSAAIRISSAVWPAIGCGYAVITRNTITGGDAQHARGIEAWRSGPGTVVRDNDIFAGNSVHSGGMAWAIETGGNLLIDANRINADTTALPTCIDTTRWCGGIASESMTGSITNNLVFGSASENSSAVLLQELEQPIGTVSLNSNYLDGAGDSASATSVSAALTFSRQQNDITSVYVLVGRVFNNILVGGQAATRFAHLRAGGLDGQANPSRGPAEQRLPRSESGWQRRALLVVGRNAESETVAHLDHRRQRSQRQRAAIDPHLGQPRR